MLIEQINEFEFKRSGPLVVHYIPETGYYHEKTKISKANLRVVPLASPDPSQVTKFNPKMQDFKLALDLTWSKETDFFNWLSNLKNIVLPNGSENVRNVIQMTWKSLYFPKNYKKSPSGWGFILRPPYSLRRLGAPPPGPVCSTFELY